jgi:TRAP-type uncharacterized transport system substrate-binding protein
LKCGVLIHCIKKWKTGEIIMNKFFKVSVASFLIVALGSIATAQSQQRNLSAETAGATGVPGNVMGHMADVLGEKKIADLQVAQGQTLTNSVRNVAEGKTDIASGPIILTFLLARGVGPYAKIGKKKGAELAANLRALYPYNAGGFFGLFYTNKGYKSWSDLKGKSIWNGPPRGAALNNGRSTLQMAAGLRDGKDYRGVQQNWGQLMTTLVDGSVDAFVIPTTWPHPYVTTMSAAGKVSVLSMPKAKFEGKLAKKLFGVPGNIPIIIDGKDLGYKDSLTLISEDGKLRGLGTAFADLVHKNMSFKMAKAITASHISTLGMLKKRTAFMSSVGLAEMNEVKSGFCGKSKLKYHAGAVAAWKEAGFNLPACAQ